MHFTLVDDRTVTVEFSEIGSEVGVVEEFDAENENPTELQREGWLGILNYFKGHVERKE